MKGNIMNVRILASKLSSAALFAAVFTSSVLQAQSPQVPLLGISRAVASIANQQVQGLAIDSQGNVYVSTQPGLQMPGALQPTVGQVLKLPCAGGVDCWSTTPTAIDFPFSNPKGLAVDSSGNLYVADYGSNAVVKISPTGASTTVGTGLQQPSDVKIDSAGDVFIADTGNDRVVEVYVNGKQDYPITWDIANHPGPVAIAIDQNNYLYVACPMQPIYKWLTQSVGFGLYLNKNWGGVIGTADMSLAVDSAGDLFVLLNGPQASLMKVSPNNTSTLLQSLVNVSPANTSGSAGLAVDSSGNPVFASNQTDSSLVYNWQNTSGYSGSAAVSSDCSSQACFQQGIVTFQFKQATNFGSAQWLTEGSPGSDFQGSSLVSCVATTGSPVALPYIPAETACTWTYKFTPQLPGLRRGAVELLDQGGTTVASALLNGTGVAPQIMFASSGAPITVANDLNRPTAIFADAKGSVMALATGSQQILEMETAGQTTINLARSNPWGFTVDGAGVKYVSDRATNKIFTSYPWGAAPGEMGNGLSSPSGIAVDGSGNLYVADTGNGRVVKIAAQAQGCNTICAPAEQTTVGTGFVQPVAVALDAAGNVYVADQALNHVFKVTPTGSTAQVDPGGLQQPSGVAVDAAGDVYISQLGGNPVMIAADLQSALTAVAIGPTYGVAIDQAGNVFLTTDKAILQFALSQPPALSFPITAAGATSNPLAITIQNSGNAPLQIKGLGVPANFTPASASGPKPGCAPELSLNSGVSCLLEIQFKPIVTGAVQSTAALSDNSLNGSPSTQSIALSGVALASQTLTFAPIPSMRVGSALYLSVSTSSGLPVTATSLTPGICEVTGTVIASQANGLLVSPGTCTIQVSQPGNAQYAPAQPVTRSFTVTY